MSESAAADLSTTLSPPVAMADAMAIGVAAQYKKNGLAYRQTRIQATR